MEWLEPKVLPERLTAGGIQVTLSRGTAIDARGQQIVLSQDKSNISLNEAIGNQILYIKYQEQESEMQGDSSTRILESPEIDFVSEENYDPAIHISLARVVINESGLIESLDLTVREYSGLCLPASNASQPAATLRSVFNEEYPNLAEFQGSLSVRGKVGIGGPPGTEHLRVQGNSAIIGSLSVSQATTLDDNVAIATTNPEIHLAIGDSGTGLNQESKGELAIYSNGKKYITLKDDGKLGVGTESPKNRLSVLGNAAIGSSFANSYSAPPDSLIVEEKIGIGTTVPKSSLSVLGNAAIGFDYANKHIAPANGLIVEGNVGIGTTNPSIHLAIGDNDTGLKQIGDGELAVCSNSHQRITIKKNGKVGIITADPKSTLSIYGEAAIGEAYANDIKAPSNGLLVQGNVGIGTNDPKSKLDVRGSTRISGSLDVDGMIQMKETANHDNAFSALRGLPNSTLLLGGVWKEFVYFYWKFDNHIYGAGIEGGYMGPAKNQRKENGAYIFERK